MAQQRLGPAIAHSLPESRIIRTDMAAIANTIFVQYKLEPQDYATGAKEMEKVLAMVRRF